ncbi:SGNH/GDSL hydrolase family protein [Nocardioides sp.]|uniref:SGNH/GDSL hydrolase family protein n=1 Tax=Nocardioides sp. TaxID=35761 RepID=UPI0027232C73|nr:SGNH/GDSL hydrolase family protein [Nocardioides sp.]MDO9454957.1 SGNH/GDSL hydrolase family protein [Nocardioides sp.]
MLRSVALVLVLALVGCSGADGSSDAALGTEAPKQSQTSEPPKTPLRVLIAGDSIAGGYYASDTDQAFPALVVDELDQDYDVSRVLVAVGGARAFRVAAQVETDTIGREPADVVVVEAGTNDIGVSTLADLTSGYTRLLDAVEATSPDAEILCLGPWDAPAVARQFETVVRRLCADHQYLRLSDLYTEEGLRGPPGVDTELGTSDRVHPNDRGHAEIARRVVEAIDPDIS